MHFHLEFGGGLGDVFNQMYQGFRYNVLRDLAAEDTASVVIMSHNPFSGELFRWHPKYTQIKITECGYWLPHEDAANRTKWNLPAPGAYSLPERVGPIEFHVSRKENVLLNQLLSKVGGKFVVVSAAAGLPDRTIPDAVLASVCKRISCPLVIVGRHYDRHGRQEIDVDRVMGRCGQRKMPVHNVVDQFSVPGVAKLLQASSGLVTCHSALNILGWHMRKPQLLLYPEPVRQNHFIEKDQWSFGCDYPETVHGTFDTYTSEMAEQFCRVIKS